MIHAGGGPASRVATARVVHAETHPVPVFAIIVRSLKRQGYGADDMSRAAAGAGGRKDLFD